MVSISSLHFDESIIAGFEVIEETERKRSWLDNPSPGLTSVIISIEYNPPDEVFPWDFVEENLRLIAEDRVNKANAAGRCLLEHELVEHGNFKMIRGIEKIPQKPHGMAYDGSLTLCESMTGFVIHVWCFEVGTTGIRDAAVLAEFMGGGTFDPTAEDWGGWWIDPFGFGKQVPVNHNISELTKYDANFPTHPLSRLRAYFPQIIRSLTFDPSLEFFGPAETGLEQKRSWFDRLFGKK